MLAEARRQALPQLARVYGRWALHLCPDESFRPPLSAHLIREQMTVYRRGGGFSGDFACLDPQLPLADDGVALVFAQHVLETSPDPEALVGELARVLEPEGTLIVLVLNPLGLYRCRWSGHGLRPIHAARVSEWMSAAGLKVEQRRYLGNFWTAQTGIDVTATTGPGIFGWMRAAVLIVARRHQPGLTPIRPSRAALAFRSGVGAG